MADVVAEDMVKADREGFKRRMKEKRNESMINQRFNATIAKVWDTIQMNAEI